MQEAAVWMECSRRFFVCWMVPMAVFGGYSAQILEGALWVLGFSSRQAKAFAWRLSGPGAPVGASWKARCPTAAAQLRLDQMVFLNPA